MYHDSILLSGVAGPYVWLTFLGLPSHPEREGGFGVKLAT
jgi:hypothetical protein